MAMAAIEMPSAMNHLGLPGIEISVFWGNTFMMSRNSSSNPSMMARLTSVTDFVIDLKGSSCFSRS
jgi:hypothetical protein